MHILQLPCSTVPVLAGWGLSRISFMASTPGHWLPPNRVWPPMARTDCLQDGRSVSRLDCCWPSPAQSFLVSVSTRSTTKIFVLSYTCTCLEMGPPLQRGEGSVFLCRRYVCFALVSARVYPHCHVSRSLWALCTLCPCAILSNIYTRYTEIFCQCRLV
jgi:hypothetical protein